MMIRDALDKIYPNETPARMNKSGRSIQQAQESIYHFFLGVVKKWPPEEVLLEFKRLFVYHVDSISADAMQALYEIVFSNNEEEFRNTLKRCCYILVNNWDATRNYKPIQDLIKTFSELSINRKTASPTLKRLRQWVENFVGSKDFEELKLFASRYEDHDRGPWAARYTSYLLVPQYIDLRNPIEQREAARTLSKQLKDRFKFDLAMYIARSQTKAPAQRVPKNPTALGDEVLRLIKAIVAKRGPFSYSNLANIFTNQIKNLPYKEFKLSLQQYLTFAIENQEFVEALQTKLAEKLDILYASHNEETVSNALILRTCNRVIEYLTTENQEEPSQLFILLLSQGNPVTLVIVLLKTILICKHARTHLEACIAQLIKYYQNYPEDECAWVVNFLEVFNVTFTIHTENVQYNLIKMEVDEPTPTTFMFDPDKYRIFSQLKRETKLELLPEMVNPETINPEIVDPEELLPDSE
ncbi:hypothetical protein K9N68_16910 [Kovacikia minuta CCNUW1]|uniref:hypothetical protein n=1 Tax=Kovacikia minuta TaxID=2931930 RepID=UPI001CCB8898|nr:hypothetical protein [Kovacikia minuta]UBF29362.1 hypothetical protein K9N68_16910 [Kovacikia minuta CCNUW1]